MSGVIHSCGHIASLKAFRPEVKYPRSRGCRPPRIDNPYNAWSWRTEINGASSGPLVGVKTGIKDNICVAGVPMLVGRDEKGFVPDSDATVVTRLLDAGTTILGKTTASDGVGIDDFENNSPFVTVRNPRRPTHAPGGSSSGSAAALVAGDINLALGSDQGGSVRIPAAWSGVVGLRPSYGLVPYTGLIATEMTMVAVGPLANTVEDIARALNVLAGPDPLDPRQRGIAAPDVDYLSSIGKGAANVRIAVVREGFNQAPWRELGLPGSERVVDQKVRAALERLQARGTTVEEVSVPAHLDGVHVFNAMYNEGNAAMVLANAVGTNFLGYYNTELMEAYGRSWRNDPNSLSPARKSVLITAEFLRQRYHGRYYAQAQNVRDTIRAAYDEVLNRYDVMVTPTVPFRATPIPPADLPPDKNVAYAMQMIANTCQSGVTGHPAISVPCGIAEGLPIGLQIIGRHLDDWTVLRIADAIERLGNWQTF
jgi:amidase